MKFTSEFVGGPLDGAPAESLIESFMPPREGDTKLIVINGESYVYEWKTYAHLPPAWRYVERKPPPRTGSIATG